MRDHLLTQYADTLESLKGQLKCGAKPDAFSASKQISLMYKGITRFIFEDKEIIGGQQRNTQRQKKARTNAYEVIRRSNA